MSQTRPVQILLDVNSNVPGSVLYCAGKTKILSSLSLQDHVPRFMLKDSTGGGWLTAEYSMLPASTHQRMDREYKKPYGNGRTMEIQRLIGRALRSCVQLKKLPRKTLIIDCDVLQADGSTRTNSINAGMIALIQGLKRLNEQGQIAEDPLVHKIAAVSIGKVQGEYVLDMNYEQDSQADYDLTVVMNEHGDLIELQGTAERSPIQRPELSLILDQAWEHLKGVFENILHVTQQNP